jgi:hypothetical protein
MITFKFLEKNGGWTFNTKVKHITYTNRQRKKRVSILRFTRTTLEYRESREFWGSFNRFLENYDENNVVVEKLYYLKRRKKWDGHDERTINHLTPINQLPRIGINDLVNIRYKMNENI